MDAESLRAFLVTYEDKLTDAVDSYFDDIAQSEAPKMGLARLLQGANIALTRLVAKTTIGEVLHNILVDMHIKAAVLGNDGNPIDAGQHMAVLDAVDEQLSYLSVFLRELPNMTRRQATSRIIQYVNAAVQTISDSAAKHLPTLPHYPGDYDLACHGFCRCWLEIERVGPKSWNVYWHLDPDGIEHCPDCIDLAKAWSPLEIRDGEIVWAKMKNTDDGGTDALSLD